MSGWLPYSPDLIPCDYFLWGTWKYTDFRNNPATLHELEELICGYVSYWLQQALQLQSYSQVLEDRIGTSNLYYHKPAAVVSPKLSSIFLTMWRKNKLKGNKTNKSP
ncbi:hypothetical protein AVEN_104354-1 [Araneus ventricosus]|uniref:Tc1-like transposase DDE domain-containing protein n=1 Tax=Araneus ventricosus TaxID=182803 RepID=A0A4Y2BVJ9_ARAVE|nr:hypothetical protein AVEN_104354-1 [Araneus ventricosus]